MGRWGGDPARGWRVGPARCRMDARTGDQQMERALMPTGRTELKKIWLGVCTRVLCCRLCATHKHKDWRARRVATSCALYHRIAMAVQLTLMPCSLATPL